MGLPNRLRIGRRRRSASVCGQAWKAYDSEACGTDPDGVDALPAS